ncbi:MAG: hypothetical protein FJ100_14525 [Deltaproteobacteria bacterium]|nr:hypothetical protein [Deltaproteobacteria bacterium]
MVRSSLVFLAVLACACGTGGGGGGSATADATPDVAVDAASADTSAVDGKTGDATTTETVAEVAADAGAEVGDATAAEAVADVPVDAGAADAGDTAADGPKEVADVAPADVAPPDIAAIDTGMDAKTEVAAPKDGQCTAEVGCKNAMMCIAPGESIGCGMCMKVETSCDSDAACNPPDTICKPLKCACGGESTCQPGCKSTAECAEGFFCAPTGKCVEDVCKVTDPPGADKSCKPNFVCKNPANPHCFRKQCQASSECEGYCVKGLCYSAPGQCSYPPP